MKRGIYTAEMGRPPQDIDGASAGMRKPAMKRAMPARRPVDDVMPEEIKQEMADKVMRKRATEAFDRAMPSAEYAKGGKVGSASKRADGIAQRGKTRGKMC